MSITRRTKKETCDPYLSSLGSFPMPSGRGTRCWVYGFGFPHSRISQDIHYDFPEGTL